MVFLRQSLVPWSMILQPSCIRRWNIYRRKRLSLKTRLENQKGLGNSFSHQRTMHTIAGQYKLTYAPIWKDSRHGTVPILVGIWSAETLVSRSPTRLMKLIEVTRVIFVTDIIHVHSFYVLHHPTRFSCGFCRSNTLKVLQRHFIASPILYDDIFSSCNMYSVRLLSSSLSSSKTGYIHNIYTCLLVTFIFSSVISA